MSHDLPAATSTALAMGLHDFVELARIAAKGDAPMSTIGNRLTVDQYDLMVANGICPR